MSNSLNDALQEALKKKGVQASPLPDRTPVQAEPENHRQQQTPRQPTQPEPAMEETFHNPYHFVPVNDDEKKRDHWLDRKTFEPPTHLAHQSHARYATGKDIHHGRILCKLTTITPTFIGAGRTQGTEDAPGVVQPFTLRDSPGDQALPAIPASSLRGLISSVAEAASNSSLRVLEDRVLSYRVPMPGLSAIGMICTHKDDTGKTLYRLRPLALPTLEKEERGNGYTVPLCYQKMFVDNNSPRLKVLIGKPPYVKVGANRDQKKFVPTYTSSQQQYYYMRLRNDWIFQDNTLVNTPQIRCPRRGHDTRFCIGQIPLNTPPSLFFPEHQVRDAQKKEWTRGIIRVLDLPDSKVRGLPGSRKHELFIPYPQEAEQWPTYPIPEEVIATFNQLADERTAADDTLPFAPYGTLRNTNTGGKDKSLRIKEGDLVFFRPAGSGEQVAEIALSSLWRRGPQKDMQLQTMYDFFSPSREKTDAQQPETDREMLPMHPKRTTISPAEMVFGFVETQEEPGTGSPKQALAYAGRVRFSHALFEPENDEERRIPFLPPVTLKILDKPKPPCPALYFTQRNPKAKPEYIAKQELKPEDHKPQGRKFYLHHREKETRQGCWKTHYDEAFFNENTTLSQEELQEAKLKKGRFKQKVVITPIPAQRTFCFHVDFDNLDAYELGMLLYALQPTPEFRHKIGMGKPLGLGSVHIEPVAVYRLDRKQRYLEQDIFTNSRYTPILSWNSSEKQEGEEGKKIDLKEIKTKFGKTMHPDIKFGLETIGNPQSTSEVVRYPQISAVNEKALKEEDEELEQYRWWVANDQGSKSGEKRPEFSYRPVNAKLEPLRSAHSIKLFTRHKFAMKKNNEADT